MDALGERTVQIDCDVIQADGGTRTAAITGAYVALNQALQMLVKNGILTNVPLLCPVAAISVGILNNQLLLDLCYEEDFAADVDFNVVLTYQGGLVEIQGATESDPFPRHQVDQVLSLASRGLEPLFRLQKEATQEF
jgi:ribonuclease PH